MEIKSDSSAILDFFAREFEHFQNPSLQTLSQIEIEITSLQTPISKPRIGIRSSVCLQSWKLNQRIYFYKNGSFASDQLDAGKRKFHFHYSSESEALEEIFYWIQSAVGEELEKSGWVRLHACGFILEDQALIIPGDSGQGKSSFILWLLENTDHQLLADEMILINGKDYLGFPMRISIKNKNELPHRSAEFWPRSRWKDRWQVSIPPERLYRQPISGRLIFLPKQSQNFASWQFRFVLGLGIAQMKEYLLRPLNLLNLSVFLWRRLKILFLLKKNCSNLPAWRNNGAQNLEEIQALVRNEKRS